MSEARDTRATCATCNGARWHQRFQRYRGRREARRPVRGSSIEYRTVSGQSLEFAHQAEMSPLERCRTILRDLSRVQDRRGHGFVEEINGSLFLSRTCPVIDVCAIHYRSRVRIARWTLCKRTLVTRDRLNCLPRCFALFSSRVIVRGSWNGVLDSF